jgi:hypothetical protein
MFARSVQDTFVLWQDKYGVDATFEYVVFFKFKRTLTVLDPVYISYQDTAKRTKILRNLQASFSLITLYLVNVSSLMKSGVHLASWSQLRSYLKKEVAAPV